MLTRSFWRYALFSKQAFTRIFAVVGVIWTFMELLDFLHIFERDRYAKWALFPILAVGAFYSIARVRPVPRITRKVPGKDLRIDVVVGDLLEATGEVVISSSTTFDTDMASGLINSDSLQGQVTTRQFNANSQALDQQITASLNGVRSKKNAKAIGKKDEYPAGTVAKVTVGANNYYFLAMSRFNEKGNASSTPRMIDEALEGLWEHVSQQGEFAAISVPLFGTGRGRVAIPRKKMIEKIAQSFVDASREKHFSSQLVIYVRPADAERFQINLFEVRDYLTQSLHA